MNAEDQEPPRPPIAPVDGDEAGRTITQLRSHTTLRTLFTATAVFAVLMAIWTLGHRDTLVRLFVTPGAACFIAGLFGFSLACGFAIGVVVTIATLAFEFAAFERWSFVLEAIELAAWSVMEVWPIALWLVTASWWGLYLRYAWSNSGQWPPELRHDMNNSDWTMKLSARDRLIARCASAPVAWLIVSLAANAFVIAVWWEMQ